MCGSVDYTRKFVGKMALRQAVDSVMNDLVSVRFENDRMEIRGEVLRSIYILYGGWVHDEVEQILERVTRREWVKMVMVVKLMRECE